MRSSSACLPSSAFYENMVKVVKCLTFNTVVGIFGLTQEDHIGKISFPPVQFRKNCFILISYINSLSAGSPIFPSSFPHLFPGKDQLRCLIPCAIDQGETGKMSASDPNSAIYVTDSSKGIKNKANRYAFSGGQDSIENHRKYGANLEVDIPVRYLNFFLEDDAELEHIKKEYGAGRMLTGEVKKRLIEILSELVERHRKARAAVTDEVCTELESFSATRLLFRTLHCLS
ncbi:putative Tryptophan--tRNA ligase, cytoplasmic [Cocos nucifera]|uniref:Tryptophan--tRNA ligase, cytoplasmic n=1 Tax=Cocos nucifera TaxID=13894 RepID=A0A8K0HWW2_COCNU|nr:putative Tryptophan--tRNA ligase, cytoplasmic [Cocos nucifera]